MAIDKFIRFLHMTFSRSATVPSISKRSVKECTFTVKEVLKSGSLGKGTAVKGKRMPNGDMDKTDIDLVVYFNDVTSMRVFRKCRRMLLDELRKKVKEFHEWGNPGIQFVKSTAFSVTYKLDGNRIDILPACDVLGLYGGPAGVYKNHAPSPRKAQLAEGYSASLAPLQINFVKHQSETVKRAIRLVKYWKREKGLEIPSYAFELMTIYAAEGAGGSRNSTSLFQAVLEMLKSPSTLKVAFSQNYNIYDFESRLWPAPYVLDPANPYMNTLSRVKSATMSAASRDAAATLRHFHN